MPKILFWWSKVYYKNFFQVYDLESQACVDPYKVRGYMDEEDDDDDVCPKGYVR